MSIVSSMYYSLFNVKSHLLAKFESEKIKKYKDIHIGERCFIVSTGPSLTMEDLEKIKNEYSISLNSIFLSKEKTTFKPTYYMIQDPFVYRNLSKDILKSKDYFDMPMFFGDPIKFRQPFVEKPQNAIYFNLNYLNHISTTPRKWEYGFGKDFARQVIDGFSITYSALQLAYYMGFSEVYLIGSDCSYDKGMHFISYNGEGNPNVDGNLRLIQAFDWLKNNMPKDKEFEIFNCTRGGMLEVFERKNLDDVIQND